jgi:hypothetical protein
MRSFTLRNAASFFAACSVERSTGTVCPPTRRRKQLFQGTSIGKLADEMDSDLERRAKNEAIFREVNERIEELSKRAGVDEADSLFPGFVCECSNDGCTDILEISYQLYDSVREHPRRFLVLPGHEDLDAEVVLDRLENALIVEKRPEVSHIATEHDPRD